MIDVIILTLFAALPPLLGCAISRLGLGRTKNDEDSDRKTEHDRAGIFAGAGAAEGNDRARREIQWQALCMEAHKNGLLWVRFLLPESGGVQNAAGLSALRDRAAKRYL